MRHLPQPLPEVFLTSFSFHLGELYWTSITGNKNGTRKCETDLRWEDGTHGGDSSLLYNAAYPAYTRHSHLGNCPEGLRHEEAPDTLNSPNAQSVLYPKEVPSQRAEEQRGNVLRGTSLLETDEGTCSRWAVFPSPPIQSLVLSPQPRHSLSWPHLIPLLCSCISLPTVPRNL